MKRTLVSFAFALAVGLGLSARPDPARADPPGSLVSALSPNQSLGAGDSGDAVRIVQHLLNDVRREAGLDPIDMDGDFGPRTGAALRAFQASVSRAETGRLDPGTRRALLDAVSAGPLGAIDPFAPTTADRYRREREDAAADVAIHALPEVETAPGVRARPLLFESKMSVDADGAGGAWHHDPAGQPSTSLRYADGSSLDPGVIPFYVLPGGFTERHPGTRPGDLAAVIRGGRVAFAIFGDVGPRGRIGEGSIALCRALGIDANPVHGGTSSGVLTIVFPGSGDGRPLSQDEIARRGAELLARAGGRP